MIEQAVFLGVVQGLTEFWPISSSAHLILLPRALGFESPLLHSLAFDVALHAGTLAAAVTYFWDNVRDCLTCWFDPRDTVRRRENRRLAVQLLIASLPAGAAGVLLEPLAQTVFRSTLVVALALILGGVALFAADRWRPEREETARLRRRTAFLVGCLQAFALVPGVSRSGAALTALRLFEFTRADSARFTFLLSIPLIAGAVAFQLPDLPAAVGPGETPALAAGVAAAWGVGYLTIRFFIRFLRHRSVAPFALYRIALGLAALLWGLPKANVGF